MTMHHFTALHPAAPPAPVTMINGMRIVVSPLLGPRPVLQIDPNFKWCTDEYRAKHNAWLLERFGMTEDAIIRSGDTVFVSRQAAEKLRQIAGREPRCVNF